MEISIVVLVDRFPVLSETFVAAEVVALRELGHPVRVEALEPGDAGGTNPDIVWSKETTAQRLQAMAWLAARHPLGCLRDLVQRRRWRREEPVRPLRALAPAARRLRSGEHLHVHFAAAAALAAMRIAAIRGVSWSVTAHAYDIFLRPANLPEKLLRADFATSGCYYTVSHLRRLAGGARLAEIVMGVDGQAFRRRTTRRGGRTVVAVGRLVEKKGFSDLIAAVGLMRDAGDAPEEVVIAGDGPMRPALEAQVGALGLGGVVRLAGSVAHEEVRELLERADVVAMPCVVAADGDRDSMPVVVKEALAMEVPVVATREVGLPEVVRPEWGTLVAPRDPGALAGALRAELGRSPAARAARGAAGRAFVLEHCDLHAETRKLSALIESAGVSR